LKKALFFFVFSAASLFSTEKGEFVVCVHGFMGSSWNMRFLERNLKKEGWDVINWAYPSRDSSIREHGKELVGQLICLAKEKPGRPIHFAAHSMGNLVLLAALNDPMCPEEAKRGSAVLIAPPFKGSAWARWLHRFSLVRWIAKGFSGNELMTKEDFRDLGDYPASLRILVIAGNLGFNPVLSGENDGTISLEETDLSTPHERVVVKRGHKTIVCSKKVCSLISQFFAEATAV